MLKESPQESMMLFMVRCLYGWLRHSEEREKKEDHHLAFLSNSMCIHKIGLSDLPRDDSSRRYFFIIS
jgi:hypothetical protein